MDPSRKSDVHPHVDTKDPSKEEGGSVDHPPSPYMVVDRDHQPINVSSPVIDDRTDIDSNSLSLDDWASSSDIPELDFEWEELSAEIWETVHPSWSDTPDPNDASEAQPTADTAQDAYDWNIPSGQTQATATPFVLDNSDLKSEWEELSAEIWETVHSSWSHTADPNDASEAQPTVNTAHVASGFEYSAEFWSPAITSASNRSSRRRQRWATATTSAPIFPFMRPSIPTQRTLPAPIGSRTHWTKPWPAPDSSNRGWAAAQVPSTAVNDGPVMPSNPIWYTPSSIRSFKPLPVPLPTHENEALPPTEPSSSENLVPYVADDTLEQVKAVDPAMASEHVSPEIRPRRTFYEFVDAVREYVRPFFNY